MQNGVQHWRYAFMYTPKPNTKLKAKGGMKYFYSSSEEDARKQYEEAIGEPAKLLIERKPW